MEKNLRKKNKLKKIFSVPIPENKWYMMCGYMTRAKNLKGGGDKIINIRVQGKKLKDNHGR